MRHFTLAAIALSLTACNLPAFRKADNAAATMTAATDTVESLQANATLARERVDQLLAVDAKLAEQYGAFVKAADQFDADVRLVTSAIESVEATTNQFLATYAATREEIKNPDLRAAMLVRKEQVERQLADLKVKTSELLTSAGAISQEFADLRKFLSANLNAQAITAASVVVSSLERRAAELEESVKAMRIELTDLAASLASERIG